MLNLWPVLGSGVFLSPASMPSCRQIHLGTTRLAGMFNRARFQCSVVHGTPGFFLLCADDIFATSMKNSHVASDLTLGWRLTLPAGDDCSAVSASSRKHSAFSTDPSGDTY